MLAGKNPLPFHWLLYVLVASKVYLQVQQWVLGCWGGVTLVLPAAVIKTKLTVAVLILNYGHSHVTPWQGRSVKTVTGALGQCKNAISPKSCHAKSDMGSVGMVGSWHRVWERGWGDVGKGNTLALKLLWPSAAGEKEKRMKSKTGQIIWCSFIICWHLPSCREIWILA